MCVWHYGNCQIVEIFLWSMDLTLKYHSLTLPVFLCVIQSSVFQSFSRGCLWESMQTLGMWKSDKKVRDTWVPMEAGHFPDVSHLLLNTSKFPSLWNGDNNSTTGNSFKLQIHTEQKLRANHPGRRWVEMMNKKGTCLLKLGWKTSSVDINIQKPTNCMTFCEANKRFSEI